MKNRINTFLISLFIFLILVISIPVTINLYENNNSSIDLAENSHNQSYPYPPLLTVLPELTRLATQIIQNTPSPSETPFPPIDWSISPPCENKPLKESEWESIFSDPNTDKELLNRLARQTALLSPSIGDISANDIKLILKSSSQNSIEKGKRRMITLLLNIVTGRLSRMSEITLVELPELRTVDDLIEKFEGVFSGKEVIPSYINAVEQVTDGEAIVQPVCAQILISKAENDVKISKMTSQGWKAEELYLTPAVKSGAHKILGKGVVSPNGKWIVFTSGGRDTGGPIFMLGMKNGAWINLIDSINTKNPEKPILDENAWWDVIGWFPDSKRVLIGPSDLRSVYIVDTSTFQSQMIALNTWGYGGSSTISLSPDQNGFVYLGVNSAKQPVLSFYDVYSSTTSTLLQIPSTDAFILYPRFSPDGKWVSFLVKKGHPTTGITYSINVFSLENRTESVLIEGNLGQFIPTWSPDSQYLAFIKKEPDKPDLVIPGTASNSKQGNLWIVDMEKQAKQLTSIHGSVQNPEWSNDGKSLVFTTHNGEIGTVNIDTSGVVWKVADRSTIFPDFTRAIFIP